MKLQTLRPRLSTVPGRLQTAAALTTQRMRGGNAVKRRARYLQLHPLCTVCEREGMVSATTQVDHKVPLWAGGQDDLETNGNPLCDSHHDAKTACEARMRAAGGWLSMPCVCGQHGKE